MKSNGVVAVGDIASDTRNKRKAAGQKRSQVVFQISADHHQKWMMNQAKRGWVWRFLVVN